MSQSQLLVSNFSSYFNDIPATLRNNIRNNAITFESNLNDQIPESENVTKISTLEIIQVIHKLKYSNSVGWDNIATKIIEANVNILAKILCNLINKSLAQGVFPTH